MRKMMLTLAALAAISIAPSVCAQEVDLVCGPVPNDTDSVRQSNLRVHIRFGDKPEMKLWDGTQPDWVAVAPLQITFGWEAKRADGRARGGLLDRQTGIILLDNYGHNEIAECLPVKRLF